jgi:hypothetical protein
VVGKRGRRRTYICRSVPDARIRIGHSVRAFDALSVSCEHSAVRLALGAVAHAVVGVVPMPARARPVSPLVIADPSEGHRAVASRPQTRHAFGYMLGNSQPIHFSWRAAYEHVRLGASTSRILSKTRQVEHLAGLSLRGAQHEAPAVARGALVGADEEREARRVQEGDAREVDCDAVVLLEGLGQGLPHLRRRCWVESDRSARDPVRSTSVQMVRASSTNAEATRRCLRASTPSS